MKSYKQNVKEVIDYAIANQISLSASAKLFGKAKNYVSNYVSKNKHDIEIQEKILSFNNLKGQNLKKSISKNVTKFIENNLDDNTKELSSSGRIKTVEDLIKVSNVDLNIWEIEKSIINKWEVGTSKNGEIIIEPLYQIKLFLKKRKAFFDAEKFKNDFLTDLKNYSLNVEPFKYKNFTDKNLLELSLFDLHLGKLSDHLETNDGYNLDKAAFRSIECITDLVSKAKIYNLDRILFPIGNDFFNSDTLYNTTTKGTPQDEESKWQRTFIFGRKLLTHIIDELTKVAPVDVLVVPGNHDYQRMFYLGDALECWYQNNKNVTVCNEFSARKYYKYGNSLIGFTHGSEEKLNDLPMIMANENPDNWAKTKYREFHLGHFHRKKDIKFLSSNETQGVTIRQLRSLSATDSWHHKKGYIGSIKSGEAFVWSYDKGLVANLFHNL